jgi:hypothetical protein
MASPLLNLICTNVPGSPAPLYSVGRRMLASYPHVPTGYELGVGIAVQSYNGKMCFGLTADASVVADVGRLRDLIGVSWGALRRAAAVGHVAVNGKPASKPRRAAPRKRPPAVVMMNEPAPEPVPPKAFAEMA